MIALGLIGLVSALIAQYFAAKAGMGFGAELRKDLFHHIGSLDYEALDRVGTPTLVTRITSDINQIQNGVNLFLRLFMRAPFLVVGATIMAASISLKLTVIFLIALPLIGLTIFLVMRYTVPAFKRVQRHLDKVVLHTRENYTGVRVVRAFSRQEAEKEDFHSTNEALKDEQMNAGRISALMNPITYAIANLGIIALLYFGGREVEIGGLTQGEIVALTNYMTQVLLALLVLANLIVSVTRAQASAVRVGEVFGLKPQMVEGSLKSGETGLAEGIGASAANNLVLEFNSVYFRYNADGGYILNDIGFTVKRGETIGIIGGTGSGKSTLVNLIPRFYDAEQGSIRVDGSNVREYAYRTLREKIGIVPQHSVLFSGSIRENMQWRKADASDEEITAALRIAQAYDFVMQKEEGLSAYVQVGGKNLSGGQKQRLCIARALVGNPEILILDDSQSALDYATDAALRVAIKGISKQITTFLVSQRVATVRGADRILVLDEGHLVGNDTHEVLLRENSVYREICDSQLVK